MVLVARFYLRHVGSADGVDGAADVTSDSETLVGWGSLPLMVERHGIEQVNVGTHVIPLFQAPVPDTDQLPTSDHYRPKLWRRCVVVVSFHWYTYVYHYLARTQCTCNNNSNLSSH